MSEDDPDLAPREWSQCGTAASAPKIPRLLLTFLSGPTEDLLPVSEVEAGVNFRLAGWVRGQVAGSLPGRQPGTAPLASAIAFLFALGADLSAAAAIANEVILVPRSCR